MKIALLIGWIMFDNQTHLFQGMRESAQKHGVNLFLFTCASGVLRNKKYNEGELNIYNLPDFSSFDGVIIELTFIQDQKIREVIIQKIKEAGIPAVSIGQEEEGFHYIGLSEAEKMYELGIHLIEEHHCRNFYYISGPEGNADEEVRRTNLLKALTKHGITLMPEHIYNGMFSPGDGRNAVQYFFSLNEPIPDVIVAGNDLVAIEVCIHLEKMGFHVPEDIIVTGVDGIKDASVYSPRITTIRRPRYEMGYEIIRWFAQDMPNHIPWKKQDMKCQLILTESCGCGEQPKTSDIEFRKKHIEKKYTGMNSRNFLDAMSAEFTSIEAFDELVQALKGYIQRFNPERFYLCTCKSPEEMEHSITQISRGHQETEEEISCYGENIYIYLAYENGEFHTYPSIKQGQLLPEECFYKDTGNFFAVSPLHFMNRCFGYLVFGNSDFAIQSEEFNLFRTILGTHFENTRKKILLGKMIKRMERKSLLDPLTGVYNRSGFYKSATALMEHSKNKKENIGIFFFDIDRLKQVNDKFGHDEGDFLIRAVSETILLSCREDHILMRYGGDEFVLLACSQDETTVKSFLENLQENFKAMNQKVNKPYEISVSTGYTLTFAESDFSLPELIRKADEKMYQKKKQRNGLL